MEMGNFWEQRRRACAKEKLFVHKKVVFERNSQGFLKIKYFLFCKSRWLSSAVKKFFYKCFCLIEMAVFQLMQDNLEKKCFLVAKKPAFSAHAKPNDKEKPFFSTAKFQFRTAPKLTCNHKFYLRNPTVSLQYNIPFSKLRSLALAVRLPFRTDSNPHRRYPETLRFPIRPVTWWTPVI